MKTKTKLQAVKGALEFYSSDKAIDHVDGEYNEEFVEGGFQDFGDFAKKALATINELIESLEGEELVEKVAEAICDRHPYRHHNWKEVLGLSQLDGYLVAKSFVKETRMQARAAINTIKGE